MLHNSSSNLCKLIYLQVIQLTIYNIYPIVYVFLKWFKFQKNYSSFLSDFNLSSNISLDIASVGLGADVLY